MSFFKEQLDNVSGALGVTEHKIDERLVMTITFDGIVSEHHRSNFYARYPGIFNMKLEPFMGKRVRITVTEILE